MAKPEQTTSKIDRPTSPPLAPAGENASLKQVIEALSSDTACKAGCRKNAELAPLPSLEALEEIVELLRSVFFPGYYGNSEVTEETLPYYIGANLDRVVHALRVQVRRGFCFLCEGHAEGLACEDCELRAKEVVDRFIADLPQVKDLLASDVEAAYLGDPASVSEAETIFCYPSMRAMANYRIAHSLYRLGVPLIPRIITELAHSETGIDIHPGATIGRRFFMDHGTGIVIGETTVIGVNVRLYQGVTLGAKGFPLDEEGNPLKGMERHPIVEDDVIIYAGATILGRVRVGEGAVIGGNVWLTRDVPPHSKIMQGRLEESSFEGGLGI